MSLAFFDMDGTLVGGDTNNITLHHFVKLGIAPSDIVNANRSFLKAPLILMISSDLRLPL